MFLIDQPYVSNFLIQTIKENNFEIIATSAAKKIVLDNSLNWISEKKAINQIKNNPNTPIYTNSENAIAWINKNLKFSKIPDQISIFKDKLKFRELLKEFYPDFYFKGIKLLELDKINTGELKFPFIIKPAIGFFSMGVYTIENLNDWNLAVKQIKVDAKSMMQHYPKEVLNTEDFIIEQYIFGEEYAIDAYFNEKGEPVILNILHHVFSSGKDVSDRVYSTSKNIIATNLQRVKQFLNQIVKKINLTNFPFHMEIRIDQNGKTIPIEINPMRFGGWCTTGDLSHYAYNINSYVYFIKGLKTDWNEILSSEKDEKYNILIMDNNSGIEENEIDYFDYDKLIKDFKNPLVLRKINFREYPLFGFLFTKTNEANENELTTILKSNLREYIKLK